MIPLTCDQRINVSQNKSNHSLNQSFPGELLRLILLLKVGYSSNYCSLPHPRKSEILAAFGTGGLWGVGRGCSSVCYRQHWDRPSSWWGDTSLVDTFWSKYRAAQSKMFPERTVKRLLKSLCLFQSLTLRVFHYFCVFIAIFNITFNVVHKHKLNYYCINGINIVLVMNAIFH